MNLFDEFRWRGLVYDATPDAEGILAGEQVVGYIGFDPTASSLHVGSLVPAMNLARMQRFGHTPVAVVGGGTGLIGDPSGRATERQLLTAEQVEENVAGIRGQLGRFLDFGTGPGKARIVNNAEWLAPLGLIDFLRDVGKHFTVNGMTSKESVRRRLDTQEGISFTEFTYMLLQAYDFLELYQRHGCVLQMGGSDQWGNITAGVELIRRAAGGRAHGIVSPLLTTAAGTKFGKTAEGTVWLDSARTSPYRFYQFWLGSDDRDVVSLLKLFTWLDAGEVAALEAEVRERPEARQAQRVLAEEVTRMVHGSDALAAAQRVTELFFGREASGLTADQVIAVAGDVPSTEVPGGDLEGEGVELAHLMVVSSLATSRGDARRAIQGGGIYLGTRRILDPGFRVTLDDMIDRKVLVVRRGVKQHHVFRLVRAPGE